jgi:arsenite methyltransferase
MEFDLNRPELVSAFDELPLWSAAFGQKLLDTIRFSPGMQVLDIGCGTGFPLIEIAMRAGAGSFVTGLDPWQVALDRAAFKIREYGVPNVRLVNGLAERMPFTDLSFDLLVSNNGLNNVSNLEETLKECYRVAKPGCQFVWTMNTAESFRDLYELYEDVLREKGMLNEVTAMHEHIQHKRPALDAMQEALIKAGFASRHITCDEFCYRFIDGTAMFKHYFIRLAFMESWKNVLPLEKQQSIFAEIESRLNSIATSRGEIRMIIPFLVFDCAKE